jgi:hypothetical protein
MKITEITSPVSDTKLEKYLDSSHMPLQKILSPSEVTDFVLISL